MDNEFNTFKVSNAEQKETIYSFLKKCNISENYIRKLRKKEGYIYLNSKVAFTNERVKDGDVIKLFKAPDSAIYCEYNDSITLCIVYEDDDILVVNKPSGMPSIISRSHPSYNLYNAICSYFYKNNLDLKVRIVNRLDKDTSGLVCVAKHNLISNLLNSGNFIEKTYLAICQGEVKDNITINKKILTSKNDLGFNNNKREISELGKDAITYVTPLSHTNSYSLCKFNLVHGRTHQIRVHMASINHPLLGDSLYGTSSPLISHTALICHEMKITNPINGKIINLKSTIPNDFILAAEKLNLKI